MSQYHMWQLSVCCMVTFVVETESVSSLFMIDNLNEGTAAYLGTGPIFNYSCIRLTQSHQRKPGMSRITIMPHMV